MFSACGICTKRYIAGGAANDMRQNRFPVSTGVVSPCYIGKGLLISHSGEKISMRKSLSSPS